MKLIKIGLLRVELSQIEGKILTIFIIEHFPPQIYALFVEFFNNPSEKSATQLLKNKFVQEGFP